MHAHPLLSCTSKAVSLLLRYRHDEMLYVALGERAQTERGCSTSARDIGLYLA